MTTPEEAIKQFLVNPLHSGFLVPEAYSTTHREALKQAGFKTTWQTARSGRFIFRALRVNIGARGPQRLARLASALEILFATTQGLESFEGRIRDHILPVVTPSEVDVLLDQKKNRDNLTEKTERAAIAAYLPLLTRLSQISGLKLTFHRSQECIIPPHADDGRIHIYPNACPPGESGTWFVETAFGLKISAGSKESPVGCGPTEGRGQVLKDEDGKSLVQILGNTWYLLIPTLGYFNSLTSVAIFEGLLALTWDAVSTGPVQPKKTLSASRFLKEAGSWDEGYTQHIDDQIHRNEEEIGRLLKLVAELHRHVAILHSIKVGVSTSSISRQMRRRLPGELKKIKDNPLVEKIEFFRDGIHIQTTPLTTSHEGVEYLTGVFTIRINKRGVVSVWSEGPNHPNGIPHPHIGKHTGPCFGNAGTAIAKAGGEARYADAVHYMLVWLTQGYTHDLATVKIHEWPVATQGDSDAATS